MNPIIKLFLQVYSQWVFEGAQETKHIKNRYGLCVALTEFCTRMGIDAAGKRMVYSDLYHMFKDDGLNADYPFNIGGGDFRQEAYAGKIYENEKRVAWVKSKIPDFEPETGINITWWLSYGPENCGIRWEDIRGQCLDDRRAQRIVIRRSDSQ